MVNEAEIQTIENILSTSKSNRPAIKYDVQLEPTIMLLIDYLLNNLTGSQVHKFLKEDRPFAGIFINDYLCTILNETQFKNLTSLALDEKIDFICKKIEEHPPNIRKKRISNTNIFIKEYQAVLAASFYLTLFKNENIKKLLTKAVDKNDLKAALIIDNFYNLLNQKEVEGILNQKNSIEKKAIDMLVLYNAERILEKLQEIPEKIKEMKSELRTVYSGIIDKNNLKMLSYIMQQSRYYIQECERTERNKFLVKYNTPDVSQDLKFSLKKIITSVDKKIYSRNEEIKNDIAQMTKNIDKAKNKQLYSYKLKLNYYTKELELINTANFLEKI